MKTVEQVHQFVEKQKMAYIGSIDKDGFPNVKASLCPRRIDGNCYYFTTRASSLRVNQFKENNKACIYFCSKGLFHMDGLMLIGYMEVLDDPKIKTSIWQPGDNIYYKGGVSDPDYCVLRFIASKARYYGEKGAESFDL